MDDYNADIWNGITDEELQSIPLDFPEEALKENHSATNLGKDEQHIAKKDNEVPLYHLRNGYLWVSDFCSQLWCEQKMFYQMTQPSAKIETPAVTAGASLHLARELAVHDIVKVAVTSNEDIFAIKLLNLLFNLNKFFNGESTCREIPIFGTPFDSDVFIMGLIDEIRCDQETFQFDIIELKTRSKFKSLPGKSQKQIHHFQIMLYKKLFDDLIKGKMDKKVIAEYLNLDLHKILSDGIQVLASIYFESLDELFDCVFDKIQALPLLSRLFVEYCSQDDNETICLEEVIYDEVWLKITLNQSLTYWKGERALKGVDIEDAWKCQRCEWADNCTWRQQKAKECAQNNICVKMKNK